MRNGKSTRNEKFFGFALIFLWGGGRGEGKGFIEIFIDYYIKQIKSTYGFMNNCNDPGVQLFNLSRVPGGNSEFTILAGENDLTYSLFVVYHLMRKIEIKSQTSCCRRLSLGKNSNIIFF